MLRNVEAESRKCFFVKRTCISLEHKQILQPQQLEVVLKVFSGKLCDFLQPESSKSNCSTAVNRKKAFMLMPVSRKTHKFCKNLLLANETIWHGENGRAI